MKLAIACLGVLGFAGVALAAPELYITKPPVVSGSDPYTGPVVDPTASQGQWFSNVTPNGLPTGGQFSLPIQFYDNPETPVNTVNGGGGSEGTDAITGVVNAITLVGGNITAFQIQAAITYDMPALSPWPSGSNSHGETLTTDQVIKYRPPTLTANFAISNLGNVPAAFNGPYTAQSPQIIATNEDLLGWYCWTPGLAPDGQSNGGYYVPAWNNFVFNGTSWVNTLDFTVDGAGLVPTDPRAINLEDSFDDDLDIFTSQSSALKIANWESSLNLDPGISYAQALEDDTIPSNVAINGDFSDVSVFLPEPGTISLVVLGIFGLSLRRRTA
ncbi:MAG: PEP-CTERM sorting domain-containing protein [Tepidisphaeraceae bacterium]|jgi:hypothetical protein